MTYGFAAVTNPLRTRAGIEGIEGIEGVGGAPTPADEVLAFHRALPGYEPTPLLSLPRLAARLGVGELLAKCEARRYGLPAFKMLGASWATYRALRSHAETELGDRAAAIFEGWSDLDDLATRLDAVRPFRLVAATDGNHGRAVARMASLLGFEATIYVPDGTTQGRIDGITSEGAEVEVVDGNYDDAVARSAKEASAHCLVISDTSWPGYTDVPRWVSEGYTTMFTEIDAALAAASHEVPDVVVVPVGVGALAAAAVRRYAIGGQRAREGAHAEVAIIGVEPTDAACVTASVLEGDLVTVEGPQHSIMAGLNCATPSSVAWPEISRGLTGLVTIDDDWARDAVRDLAACGIEAGETGSAALAGLTALRTQGGVSPLADRVHQDASVLVLVTEGASDRAAWQQILGVRTIG